MVMLFRFWLCLAVLVLAGGCQCFVALSIVADGNPATGNLGWTQSGGDPANCGATAGFRAIFP